jgi:hypothetical protein
MVVLDIATTINKIFNNMNNKTLRERFNDVCEEYVKLFVKKHGYEDVDWVDDIGDIICISDMYISFDDIRYDIDNNIPEESFEKWYWKSVERASSRIKYMNYKSFCKGCPDPISPEQEEEIEKARQRLEEARAAFDEAVADFRTNETIY